MAEKKAVEVQEVPTKKIKVIEVNEITANNGNKFTAYKTVNKDGRKMDLRFTKECIANCPSFIPKEPCFIYVPSNMANVDQTRQYPVLWVKEVVAIELFERTSNLDEWFD